MGVQKVDVTDVMLTQQNAKEECDINIIVERAKRGAGMPVNEREPMYGDFTDLPDYREALLIVNQARDAFMALDANVRKRFANDPALMLDFLAKEENRDEAVKLGLVNAPPPVDDVPPENINTPVSGDRRATTRDSFEAPPPAAPLDKRVKPR